MTHVAVLAPGDYSAHVADPDEIPRQAHRPIGRKAPGGRGLARARAAGPYTGPRIAQRPAGTGGRARRARGRPCPARCPARRARLRARPAGDRGSGLLGELQEALGPAPRALALRAPLEPPR